MDREFRLKVIQREMVLAHKRGAWNTVRWLAPKAEILRKERPQGVPDSE